MFRDVPACSGMFRNVPCSWFYRRPQKFSFKLPVVLKTDFERRDNALYRGLRLVTEIEVPVDDFGL